MNKAFLIGNLAADPELKKTTSGKSVCQFRIGVRRDYKNADGNYDADFFPIITWNQTAEFCAKYLKKGNRVAIDGRIETRSYDAQDGSKRYITEIVANSVESLTPKSEGETKNAPNYDKPKEKREETASAENDDELPF